MLAIESFGVSWGHWGHLMVKPLKYKGDSVTPSGILRGHRGVTGVTIKPSKCAATDDRAEAIIGYMR